MTCGEFLNRYTDFRDGLIGAPREVRRFQRHLSSCQTCRAYDATVRRGVVALQAMPTLTVSTGFRRRLAARLEAERDQGALPPVRRRARVAATLLVAAALGLILLEGTHRPTVALTASLPPVPFPKPVARAGLPFVSFQDPRASVLSGNPNPYGTAFVPAASIAH